jgi:hypothetical protein
VTVVVPWASARSRKVLRELLLVGRSTVVDLCRLSDRIERSVPMVTVDRAEATGWDGATYQGGRGGSDPDVLRARQARSGDARSGGSTRIQRSLRVREHFGRVLLDGYEPYAILADGLHQQNQLIR